MSKHEIEVEGLPEGWEPVAFRMAHNDEHRVINGIIERCDGNDNCESLIVKKKQPRRIAFEETDYANVCDSEEDVKWTFFDGEYWREVKETEGPKLCLSVEECENILCISVLPISVEEKMELFLRNNNKTS